MDTEDQIGQFQSTSEKYYHLNQSDWRIKIVIHSFTHGVVAFGGCRDQLPSEKFFMAVFSSFVEC
jgi:hypothetical protein